MEASPSRDIVCRTMLDFIFTALAVGIMWLDKFSTLICTNNLTSSDYFWKFEIISYKIIKGDKPSQFIAFIKSHIFKLFLWLFGDAAFEYNYFCQYSECKW